MSAIASGGNDPAVPNSNHLASHYGKAIAVYTGTGTLSLATGEDMPCRFEAGQLTDGEVLLLCDLEPPSWESMLQAMFMPPLTAPRFTGKTSDNRPIVAEGLTSTTYLAKRNSMKREQESGEWLTECYYAFHVSTLEIGVVEPEATAKFGRFGLVNFCFDGMDRHTDERGEATDVMRLALVGTNGPAELIIRPLQNAKQLMASVATLKGIDVTCEAIAAIPEHGGFSSLRQTVEDVCYLLSVARGTKIQWVYFDQYDGAGNRLTRCHWSRFTRRHSPLAIVRGITAQDGQIIDRTRVFVEQTYPKYVQLRVPFKLDSGTIDSYLEAKAETDLLEMRGVKLAVAMEALKAVFLELPDCPAKEFIVEEQVFGRYISLIQSTAIAVLKAVLKFEGSQEGDPVRLTAQDLQSIFESRKLEALNRSTFRMIMSKLFGLIGFNSTNEETRLFVQCRNSLVHRGRFYATTATELQRRECPPCGDLKEEYFFLVSFLDRVFLKLLSYSGPYTDFRFPWNGNFGNERVI